jgi:hypothetical protein
MKYKDLEAIHRVYVSVIQRILNTFGCVVQSIHVAYDSKIQRITNTYGMVLNRQRYWFFRGAGNAGYTYPTG